MTTTDIKNTALAVALGAVAAAIVDVVVHGAIIGSRPGGRGLAGGLMIVMIMARLTWAAVAFVAWIAAPLLSRWLQAGEFEAGSSQSRPAAFMRVGRLMLALPILWVLGTWLIGAVKITLLGSWRTEGTVFIAGYYYLNLLTSNVPWLVGGLLILAVSKPIPDPQHAA